MSFALTAALSFACLNIIIFFFSIEKVNKDQENQSHQKEDISFNFTCSGFRFEGFTIIQEQWGTSNCCYSGSIQVNQLHFALTNMRVSPQISFGFSKVKNVSLKKITVPNYINYNPKTHKHHPQYQICISLFGVPFVLKCEKKTLEF